MDCEDSRGAIDLKVYFTELRVQVAFVRKWMQYTCKLEVFVILNFNIVILSSPRSRKWFSFTDFWNTGIRLPD